MMGDEFYNLDEINSIKKGLSDILEERVTPLSESMLENNQFINFCLPYNDNMLSERPSLNYTTNLANQSWSIYISDEFRKTLNKLDKELHRKILTCIVQLAINPLEEKGDTIKPLQGRELKGLWRYRLGDYRLLYKPNPKEKTVTLVTIAPRGKAYA